MPDHARDGESRHVAPMGCGYGFVVDVIDLSLSQGGRLWGGSLCAMEHVMCFAFFRVQHKP